MVFTGFRDLNRDATQRSRNALGIDSATAAERAMSFDKAERAELRRLFFEIDAIE